MGGNSFHCRGTGHRERASICSTRGSRFTVIDCVMDGAPFGSTSDRDRRGNVVKTDNRCGTPDVHFTLTYVGIYHIILNCYRFDGFTSQFL